MKSVGDRIRQAREFRKMSGEELAHAVGYKTQSGISNLENRGTGMGGAKIVEIARVLNFSLQWLLNGPDTADLASVPPFSSIAETNSHGVREHTREYRTKRDNAHALIDAMSTDGIDKVLELLRMTAEKHPRHQDHGAGISVPAPEKRAA